MGLKPSDAVSMLMAKIVSQRGIPFAVQEDGYAYALGEYGATRENVDTAHERMKRNIARERKAGTIKRIGKLEDLLDED
jgi:antitoxin component of RelBE/YafQ-DinJ toxin-antitoxin module